MAKLTDFRLLSFDVYGTLIDWETGILHSLKPLYEPANLNRAQALELYHSLEKDQQAQTPQMPYSHLLAAIYPRFATETGSEPPPPNGGRLRKVRALGGRMARLRGHGGRPAAAIEAIPDARSLKRGQGRPSPPARRGPAPGGAGSTGLSRRRTSGPTSRTGATSSTCSRWRGRSSGWRGSGCCRRLRASSMTIVRRGELGIRSVWIERRGAMGNRPEEIYDWEVATLGEMADAVERELP